MASKKEKAKKAEKRKQAGEWARQRREEEEQNARDDDPRSQRDAVPSKLGLKSLADACQSQEIPACGLYHRSSDGDEGKLEHIKAGAILYCEETLGVKVAKCVCVEETGKAIDREKRPGLYEARDYCLEHGLPLVLICWSRGRRHKDFNVGQFYNKTLVPSELDFVELIGAMAPVQVYVLIDNPDSTLDEDKAFIGMLARLGGANVGGRPKKRPKEDRSAGYKKRQKEKWLPLVLELHEAGKSSAEIMRGIQAEGGPRIAPDRICRWIREETATNVR